MANQTNVSVSGGVQALSNAIAVAINNPVVLVLFQASLRQQPVELQQVLSRPFLGSANYSCVQDEQGASQSRLVVYMGIVHCRVCSMFITLKCLYAYR